MKIIVNDKMQKNYTYETSEPIGQNFAPDFLPELTPAEMLHMGVFEGKYLNDCRNEFPADWFRNAALAPQTANAGINFFHLKSRLSLQEWQNAAGFTARIPAAGFNGIAAIISVAACRKLTASKSGAGNHSNATKSKLKKTAGPAIWDAVPVNVRHCCNGPITLLSKRSS